VKPLCLEENGENGQRAGRVQYLINIEKIYFKISMLIKNEKKWQPVCKNCFVDQSICSDEKTCIFFFSVPSDGRK